MESEELILQELVKNAIYNESDLMLLQIAKQNYLQEHESYLAEYKANIYDLNLLCGINDDEDAQIQDTTFTQNKAITTPSVFLKSFLLDSMSIATDQRITNLKYQPHVNAFAIQA